MSKDRVNYPQAKQSPCEWASQGDNGVIGY